MPSFTSRIEPVAEDGKGNQQEIDPAAAMMQQGPVIVPVTLTLLDKHRQEAGMKGRKLEPVTGAALVDTGASRTCLDTDAASQARLPVVGKGLMSSASHTDHEVPLYAGTIQIPGFGNLRLHSAMGAALANQGIIALIGRDALRGAIFIYNGIDGSFVLSR